MAGTIQNSGAVSQFAIALALLLAICGTGVAQSADFHRTLLVTSTEPVILDIALSANEVEVAYSRDGQVSITASAQGFDGSRLDSNFFGAVLAIQQNGNQLTIRHVRNPLYPEDRIRARYRIDVPYRTQVISKIDHGRQSFTGIMGPVQATAEIGDIQVSYLAKGLHAQTGSGNLDLQVIGGRGEAKTGKGNITGTRLGQGVAAETGDGDITLAVVGPSTAIVRQGGGRIDVSGAQGNLTGSTFGGELHVKAVPRGKWKLNSDSGNIRVELPPATKFDLDVSTDSGTLQLDRDDIAQHDSQARYFHQAISTGSQRIEAHTGSGRILVR